MTSVLLVSNCDCYQIHLERKGLNRVVSNFAKLKVRFFFVRVFFFFFVFFCLFFFFKYFIYSNYSVYFPRRPKTELKQHHENMPI